MSRRRQPPNLPPHGRGPGGDYPEGPWSEVGRPGWDGSSPGYRHDGSPERGNYRPAPPPPSYAPGPPPGHYQGGYQGGNPPPHQGGTYPAGRQPPPPRPPRGADPTPAPRGPKRASAAIVLGRILSGLLSLALIAGSGLIWSAVGGAPPNSSNATDRAGDVGVVTKTTDAQGNVIPVAGRDGINVLVVGTDARTDAQGHALSPDELAALHTSFTGGARTDTIMLLHVPADDDAATIVSLPRDIWVGSDIVSAPGMQGPTNDGGTRFYEPNKINAFYAIAKERQREYLVSQGVSDDAELERRSSEAGRTMLIKVVQQFTGIKVDHYVEVNLIGFYLMSKAIGGVPVCLLNPTQDKSSGADFPAGHFEVKGGDALAFVRQRHGLPRGDLDRIRRQQMFLASAADKILSLGTLTSPSRLSALVDAADRSLVMDEGFDLLSFAQQIAGLSSGNINFATVPTDGREQGVGTWAFHTDPTQIEAFFTTLMTDKTSSASAAPTTVNRGDVIVDVQNGTETAGVAGQIGQVMADSGFERGQIANYPGTTAEDQQATTTVRYSSGGKAAAAMVRSVLGVGDVIADDDVPAGHVLVVVGTDLAAQADALAAAAAAGSHAPSAAPTTSAPPTTLPSNAINAADPGCIN